MAYVYTGFDLGVCANLVFGHNLPRLSWRGGGRGRWGYTCGCAVDWSGDGWGGPAAPVVDVVGTASASALVLGVPLKSRFRGLQKIREKMKGTCVATFVRRLRKMVQEGFMSEGEKQEGSTEV